MAQTIRTFIAVPLDGPVRDALGEVVSTLSAAIPDPIKWARPDAMHITLKFLGDVPLGEIEALADAVRRAASAHEPFAVKSRLVDAFPSARRPRTLVVRLSDDERRLEALAGEVEQAAKRLGYPREPRGFSPHVTLGRSKRDARLPSLEHLLGAVEVDDVPEIWADQVWLIQSELTRKGPEYTPMEKLALCG